MATISERKLTQYDGQQDSTSKPLVRYNQKILRIPGDRYGQKLKHTGNVAHPADPQRAVEFTEFDEADFTFPDNKKAETLRRLLSGLARSFLDGQLVGLADFKVICDTPKDTTVEFTLEGYACRVSQFRDVLFSDPSSYGAANRAQEVERRSAEKIDKVEGEMGRAVANYMMAVAMSEGDSPPGNQKKMKIWYKNFLTKVTLDPPDSQKKRKIRYRNLRMKVTREFWVELSPQEREELRQAAKTEPLPEELRSLIAKVEAEDHSHDQDYYYQHHKDWTAAEDPSIYPRLDKDILLVLDKDGNTILAMVSKLFQSTFGEKTMAKSTEAALKWTAIPHLPQPDTARHMVDELVRKKHPELDMELAKTPKELEQRAVCVVHYGTWTQRGHHARPQDVYLTPDTRFIRGATYRERADYGAELFPRFKRGVLGVGSDVARFLLSAIDPGYYQQCVDYFKAIPEVKRMEVSAPDWATLIVLGVRSWTERHKDTADVRFGFATLVALGDYTGGDLCFPQLGFALPYQPGCCVMFRGAELQHFVTDWSGDRVFLTYTNHQAVRNWVDQGARTLVPPPEEEDREEDDDDSGSDLDHVPCVEMDLDIDDDEDLTDKQIHGAGTWSPERNLPDYTSSSSSGSSGASAAI